MCAHGGDAAIGHPANTREAVLAAAAAGSRCVELDLSITADGQLVPLHARELQLLSGRPAAQVADLLLADVEALEWCGTATHPALTLHCQLKQIACADHGGAGDVRHCKPTSTYVALQIHTSGLGRTWRSWLVRGPKHGLLSCLSACGHGVRGGAMCRSCCMHTGELQSAVQVGMAATLTDGACIDVFPPCIYIVLLTSGLSAQAERRARAECGAADTRVVAARESADAGCQAPSASLACFLQKGLPSPLQAS